MMYPRNAVARAAESFRDAPQNPPTLAGGEGQKTWAGNSGLSLPLRPMRSAHGVRIGCKLTCTPQSSFEDPFPSGNVISHHQPGNIRGDRCNYWFEPDYFCRTSMEVRGRLETVIAFDELWIKLPIHACRDLCDSRVLPIINPRVASGRDEKEQSGAVRVGSERLMEQCGEANGDKPSRAAIVTKSGAGGPRPSWGAERNAHAGRTRAPADAGASGWGIVRSDRALRRCAGAVGADR